MQTTEMCEMTVSIGWKYFVIVCMVFAKDSGMFRPELI